MTESLFVTFDPDLCDPDLCDLDLQSRSQWYMFWSALSQRTFVPSFVTVASIVSMKYAKVTFHDLWLWPLWPWPLVYVTVICGLKCIVTKNLCAKFWHCTFKVTVIYVFWSALSHSTFWAKFGDCYFNSYQEIWQNHFSWPLTLTFVTLTFSQGHSDICFEAHFHKVPLCPVVWL